MKISFFILTIILFPLLMSCNKEENIDFNTPPENTEHVNYHIKYEASCNSKYIGNVMKISVKTESGTQTFEGGRSFSQTFGPVHKGFNCKIDCFNTSHSSSYSEVIVNIYVSREKEPFALKKTASGTGKSSASYTINF